MFVNKDSIIINGINMGQYLVQAEYQYNKLWAKDSGRNLAGMQTGTLIGIFPKLILQFRPLTQNELHLIAPILDSARQTVSYFDINKNAQITITTYTGDWSIINKNIQQNQGFSCSFISTKKRS